MQITAVIASTRAVDKSEYSQFDYVVVVPGNDSPARKRNRGVELAITDVVAFFDDDAVPIPGWKERCCAIFDENPDVVLVGGPSIPTPTANAVQKLLHRIMASASESTWKRYAMLPEQITDWQSFAGCSIAVRRLSSIRWNERYQMASGEDMDYVRQVAERGKCFYSPALAVWHNPHGVLLQLKRIFLWGRDAERNNSKASLAALLFPFLWCVFALMYGVGKSVGYPRKISL